MDINKPVEPPALVDAINRLFETETPEIEKAMFEELKAGHFLATVAIDPPPPPGEGGQTAIPESTTIKFEQLVDPQGRAFFTAFTDWDELRKWRNAHNQQTLVMRLDDYGTMLEDGRCAE